MDKVILKALEQAGIEYEAYQHPAFTSCEISAPWHQASGKPGVRVKNLFLRNKNGKQHFLLLLPHHKAFDKTIFKAVSGQKCGLADDQRLWKYLQVKPGAVSPLALVHDTEKHVQLFIEQSLLQQAALHLHPGDSEWSVQLTPSDLVKFVEHLGYCPKVVEWESVE